MKTISIAEFNADPIAQDVPAPVPADGEVLVDVEFASVNGMDAMTWAGYIEGMMPYELPITLGRDFSGTVSALGAGVEGLAVGDPVFGMLMSMPLHAGTFAESITVPTWGLTKRPSGLDAKSAGSLGLAGTAAKTAVDALAPTAGQTVLIAGATGGVGAIAIQLAKAQGATVIATAATPEEVLFVRDLGADETVDYRGDLAAAVGALYPGGVDAVLHAAGDGVALAGLAAPGGRFASTLGVGPDQLAGRDIEATVVMAIPSSDTLSVLAAAVADGTLRVPIGATYPLDQVSQALKDFTSGTVGKIAVAVR
ncbi:NADPH:quinone reductase-like Zn-dependent oxidoreductase [Mycolicibacterium sp. BK556]|uniref:NADP-dependent oxidoreductase n=1 Tax=Mycobacteriaceae TaxID=1762 RepID=UPI000D394FA8|nr:MULTISPECIES: NADP-dependent oxidoreductase [Mycobacteriaceae]MBB3606543.1 NADPH:quinone reductase-like Zn-dependent oxidoreductase [Mycolicibacterium sp. BK556]MBB3636211.1 NADPH:quinone reductase-like Zn-dependent oxidoreductase [Mycolicibacterium sp. BK607]MBB3753503.1 NADPH:quinone reductase-like Zn-dependent oxidoreductase [Mycolicibacterium sp. BK634]TDO06355.1 NADPH:quinone reductase-like Zn-dependent oxidoreductase [Mycobacterium sp. BK086]